MIKRWSCLLKKIQFVVFFVLKSRRSSAQFESLTTNADDFRDTFCFLRIINLVLTQVLLECPFLEKVYKKTIHQNIFG